MTLHSGSQRPRSWSRSITFAAMWAPPPGWITLIPLLWPINRSSCKFQDQWKVIEGAFEMKLFMRFNLSFLRFRMVLRDGNRKQVMLQSSWVKTWHDEPSLFVKHGWNILAAEEDRKWQELWQKPIFLWCLCQAMRVQHRRKSGMILETRSESKPAADLFSPIKGQGKRSSSWVSIQQKRKTREVLIHANKA